MTRAGPAAGILALCRPLAGFGAGGLGIDRRLHLVPVAGGSELDLGQPHAGCRRTDATALHAQQVAAQCGLATRNAELRGDSRGS